MRRALVVAGVVATAGCWLSTVTHPAVAAAVVSLAVGLATTRWLRWRQVDRQIVAPTVDTLRHYVAADVTLRMTPAFRAMIPRPAGRLSPLRDVWTMRVVDRLSGLVPDRLRLPRRPPRLTITFATGYLGKEQREVVNAVITNKLGVDGLTQQWNLRGRTVTATWTPRARPPARVAGDTVRSALPVRDSSFYLGAGAGGVPVVVDLDNDSPHILVSGGAGSGKSTLVASIAVQALVRGGRVMVLDIKTSSHPWATGLRDVIYATSVERCHHVLVKAAEMTRARNADPDRVRYRLLIVVEEANSLVTRLRQYWETHREPSDPRQSPAIAALQEITHTGRAAKVHLVLAGQQVTARAAGGAEARESYGVRLLARYTANSWRMLAGPGVPMPPRTRHPGRWHLVVDDQVVEVQAPLLTAGVARRILGVPTRPHVPVTAVTRDVPGDNRGYGDTPPSTLTISEAIAEGVIPWPREATKKRLQRAPTPPRPVGTRGRAHVYRRDDLEAWVARETGRQPV